MTGLTSLRNQPRKAVTRLSKILHVDNVKMKMSA